MAPVDTVTAPAPERHLTSGHVLLFLQGAWVTLLVSALSFLLASPLGLALATLRLYAGGPARSQTALL